MSEQSYWDVIESTSPTMRDLNESGLEIRMMKESHTGHRWNVRYCVVDFEAREVLYWTPGAVQHSENPSVDEVHGMARGFIDGYTHQG